MMYFIYKEVPNELKFLQASINFFTQYHGKSEVDSHFEVSARRQNEGELYYNINNLDALVSLFNAEALEEENEEKEQGG